MSAPANSHQIGKSAEIVSCRGEDKNMLTNKLTEFLKDESGATAIEYGLIAGLVSVAAIGALQLMGTSLVDIFTVVQTELDSAAQSATSSGSGSGTGDGSTGGTGTGG